MTAVFALISLSIAVSLLAPLVLARGTWRVRYPALAIALWLGTFTIGVTSLTGSVVVASVVVLVHAPTELFGEYGPMVASLFLWVGLGGVGALITLALTRSEPLTEAQRTTDIAATLLAARSRYRVENIGGDYITYITDDRLIACCTADGRILISSGIEQALPPAHVRAIIEHERSHVRSRHARVIQLAQMGAACFPFLACAREFGRTIRLLSELAADDAAARVCGPAHLCNALNTLGTQTGDDGMLLRAERLASYPISARAHRRHLEDVSVVLD